ncbi:hypothetical protein AAX26_01649 [Aliarcobacter thereius]|uniref:hypothetical protein n=1 Tax=Aliarcobacter thereius TaxID=544718 RepID=UPI000827BD22|nr:hypothetical protein [Aliarcobacter thereius]OCL85999.1 hypothetical protein AAX26_01649 [Aliarcobacter thereius]
MNKKKEIRNTWDNEKYIEFSIKANVNEELLYLIDDFFTFLQIIYDNYIWKEKALNLDYFILDNNQKTKTLKTSDSLRFKPNEYEKMFTELKEKTKKSNNKLVNNILSYGAMVDKYLPKSKLEKYEILKLFTDDEILIKEYRKEIEEENIKIEEIRANFLKLCNKKVC